MEPQNTQLVERARRQDSEAFALLVRSHERVAMSIAYGVLGDAAAACDVVQVAFFRAWKWLAELREPERFGSWLCGIVRNQAIDARRRRRISEPLAAEQPVASHDRWIHDPLEDVCRKEDHAKVAAAITHLDDVSRMAVVMRYYEDLSSSQIGRLLQISPQAVDMRLSRARKRLKSILSDESGQPALLIV
ncbi:MAG TPA: sigma-70 family RNA polymerase sigma factor [Tepidisphaeraceae bacterium]|nr:sigma-70 family RNA polymerase sigma factor [Tepidisphaeraceae bacterium]